MLVVLALVAELVVPHAVGGLRPGELSEDFGVAPPALADCTDRLTEAGVSHAAARIPPHPAPSGAFSCGAEQIVRYRRGPEAIRWGSSPKLTCQMALSLARFERIAQEVAVRELGRRIARVEHVGTYSCREMVAYPGWVSEHSFANAIDLRAFVLRDGRKVSVREYDSDRAAGRFLRALSRRLFDERVFRAVLTPAFDSAHRGHLHFDLGALVVDGTRPDG